MAITAKFDLKTVQMNVINMFVNSKLNEVMYMRQPPDFEKGNTVLQLNKALYGLRRSSLLWQKELISTFHSLEFKKLSQESCVMINEGIITFFYVDDIVICFRKKDEIKACSVITGLQVKYKLSRLENLKWFLEIHILRDRAKNLLWLSQEVYIDKIANQFNVDLTERLPDTPMISELLPNKILPNEMTALKTASKTSIHFYQTKIDFILFAVITT